MASIEHCLYCFEALASHLEDRKSMELAEVEESYAEYLKFLSSEAAGKAATKRHPALERLAASRSAAGTASPALSESSVSSIASSSSDTPAPASSVTTPATSTSSLPVAPRIEESPLFVTWNVLRRDAYTLRGCIGTFEPQDLEDGLSSYALTSALHDLRFSPVTARELPSLQAAVTLLTDFEDAADETDWELGVHGIRISFAHHGRRYGATYLPDVAVEQGWSKEETLVSLMRKAGWVGKKDRWREVELKVVRYQGKKESCEYAEYKAWRDWVVVNEKA